MVRKFNLRQYVCPIRTIVATEATQTLMKRVADALCQSLRLRMSTRSHVESRAKASPKRPTEATGGLRITVTNITRGSPGYRYTLSKNKVVVSIVLTLPISGKNGLFESNGRPPSTQC
jgi:hypothetical protein